MVDANRLAMVGRFYNRQGGISRCIAELAERAARDREVTVFANEILDRRSNEIRVEQVRMLRQPFWLQSPSFAVALRRRLTAGRFNVIHAHGPQALRADVYTAHSCHAAWLTQRRSESRLKGLASRLYPPHAGSLLWERRCFGDESSLVIAISQRVRSELESVMGLSGDRVRVIYNGVDTQAFTPAPSRSAARTALPEGHPPLPTDGGPLLLFAGYEFHRKGLAQAVRAVAGLSEAHLWVSGGDDPTDYVQMARELGANDRVHFLGHQADIAPWLRAADALVFPTHYEPFGLVVLEALACGTPVIASRAAGAAELITDGIEGALLDNPLDVAELRVRIRATVAPERADKRSAAARVLAERYDWDEIWRQTAALYDSVASVKRSGGPARAA